MFVVQNESQRPDDVSFDTEGSPASSVPVSLIIQPPIVGPDQEPVVQVTSLPHLSYLAGSLRAAGIRRFLMDGLGEKLDGRHSAGNDCRIPGLYPDEVVARTPDDNRTIDIYANFSCEWLTSRDLIEKILARPPQTLLVGGGEHATALLKESGIAGLGLAD